MLKYFPLFLKEDIKMQNNIMKFNRQKKMYKYMNESEKDIVHIQKIVRRQIMKVNKNDI